MPHIILEYSEDLAPSVDFVSLLETLHNTLGGIESFEMDRIKSRAVPCGRYRVGREAERRFVHATVSFSPGRSDAVRAAVGQRFLDLLASAVRPRGVPVSRSVEVRQFEPGMYFNDHESQRTAGEGKGKVETVS